MSAVPEQSMKALANGMDTMQSPEYARNKLDSPVDEKAGFKYDDSRLETVNELDPEALKNGKVDYSGFAKKSDPREIALVRKLDIRIMGSLWSMVGWELLLTCSPVRGLRMASDLPLCSTGSTTSTAMLSRWQSFQVSRKILASPTLSTRPVSPSSVSTSQDQS